MFQRQFIVAAAILALLMANYRTMTTTTNSALLLSSKQGDFAVGSLPIPTPGPGELLVKLQAAGLNPVDWKIHKYGIFVNDYPAVLGTDAAGDVVEVGKGVNNFFKNDKVFFQGLYSNERTSFQRYTIAVAATTAKIPASLTYDEAASIPLGLATAYIGLYQTKPNGFGLASPLDASSRGKYTGNPILILGGSGSVGQYVIQLVKASGFSPIIATSSLKHSAYLKTLGATHVIDRSKPLEPQVKAITTDQLEYIYDAVSTDETQQAAYHLLSPGGHLALILHSTVAEVEGKIVVQVAGALSTPGNLAPVKELYSQLTGLLKEGVIKPNRVDVVPGGLAGIPDALTRMQNGQISGVKLVAHPQD